ncbi:MAG: NAD(P)-dependent oxidoreductase [Myxococcota bacterium]
MGWIGLGVMGAPMCGHLQAAGYAATVFTRSETKAEPAVAKGAAWVGSPRAVAAESDVVFTMVGLPRDVREVVLGEDGVLAGLAPGGIVVDMTTSEPALAEEIAAAASARGCAALDAPVSGGDVGAREARLSIMVGGDAAAFAAVEPAFQVMGQTVVHQGAPGAGQHTKAVNQTLVANNMIGVCEALVYAVRAGLDPETVLASVAKGAAGSFLLSGLAPRMIAGDYAPGFYVEHFVKDLGIVLAESARMGIDLPGARLARELYTALAESGHARDGTQALILSLAEGAGVDWPPNPT